jgi:hypothetical protein
MNEYVHELEELERGSREWLKARECFQRQDPDGYLDWDAGAGISLSFPNLHPALLEDEEFRRLSTGSKGLLLVIWLLCVEDGEPIAIRRLAEEAGRLSHFQLESLVLAGFIEVSAVPSDTGREAEED